MRLDNIVIDRFKRGLIRYDDLPDGPSVKCTFGETVFARGVVTAHQWREWIRKDWIRFSEAAHGNQDEHETLYSIATPIQCCAVKVVDDPKE